MSSLWRTERPRFPMYTPDGKGRDYYIKFSNGGYWENQFQLKKVPDYERTRYYNFHTLFHQAAPFKYWGNGHGRETYILETNGLFHDQKPLCAYKLSDFLRNSNKLTNGSFKGRMYMSVSEKKYNDKLKQIEGKLIKRLYTEPMKLKREELRRKKEEDSNYKGKEFSHTFTSFPKLDINTINGNSEKIPFLEEEKEIENYHQKNLCTSIENDRDYKQEKRLMNYRNVNNTISNGFFSTKNLKGKKKCFDIDIEENNRTIGLKKNIGELKLEESRNNYNSLGTTYKNKIKFCPNKNTKFLSTEPEGNKTIFSIKNNPKKVKVNKIKLTS